MHTPLTLKTHFHHHVIEYFLSKERRKKYTWVSSINLSPLAPNVVTSTTLKFPPWGLLEFEPESINGLFFISLEEDELSLKINKQDKSFHRGRHFLYTSNNTNNLSLGDKNGGLATFI